MSEPVETTSPPASPKSSPAERLVGVIMSPIETMRQIASAPDILVPLIVVIVIAVVSSMITTPHLDLASSLEEQFAKQGLSEEQIDRAIDIAEKFQKVSAPIAAVMIPVMLLVIAGVPLLAFKVFGVEHGTFKQFFSVALYAWMPQNIKYVIFTGIVAFKQKLTLEEMANALKSNPAFMVSMSDQPAMYTFLSQIDFFIIWTLVLLVIGYAFAARISRAKAALTVGSLWFFILLVRTGLAMLQGMGGPR